MSASPDQHILFWRTLASELGRGTACVEAVARAGAAVPDKSLQDAAKALGAAIQGGSSMSEAMAASPDNFSACVTAMVRAGEAGGVLDVICARILDGLRDGSFPVPGGVPPQEEPVRFWRAFGRMLRSGVPVIQAVDLLRQEIVGGELADAGGAIRQAILDGKSITAALREFPDLFAEEVCFAVELGETQGDLGETFLRIGDALERDDLGSLVADPAVLEASRESAEERNRVVEFVADLLRRAAAQKASDVHLDPTEDGRGRIRIRVDGVLQDVEAPAEGLFARVVSRIKIMADLDIAERRLPQDGRILMTIDGKQLDLRVCLLPTVRGERVVMRILAREHVALNLERCGLLEDDLATVQELCHLPNGLVICNGPTGSGKTTLLYAMLNSLDCDRCCVMSVEDPVEYRLPGIAQVQVDARRGVTFARALRSILRQDPDVIMVGEIRDLESLQVTVQCSLTGHLVLTTLHANTSPGAIRRLLDMGLEPFLVNATVAGVVSLRLVRVLCPECKEPVELPLHSLPAQAAEFVRGMDSPTFYGAKGCDQCRGTGYRGRRGIFEILVPSDRVRQAVAAGSDLDAIRNAALASGMRPMLLNGMRLAARGITSVQEACRVVPHGPND